MTFHGWQRRDDLADLYGKCHVAVLASESEGWPKVLSEAMAAGAVPVASAVSCIPHVLESCATGTTFPVGDVDQLAEALRAYVLDRSRWQRESKAGRAAASRFTYEAWLVHVRRLLGTNREAVAEATASRVS